MSDIAAAPSEPAELVRVKDDDRVLEFTGGLVAASTTWQPGRARWLELKLYRITDGTGRYVIGRVGKSTVYHRVNGPCNRGAPVPASAVTMESMPCGTCAAPALAILKAMPDGRVSREIDHYSAIVCASAKAVLSRLRLNGDDDNADDSAGYSAPAQRLLDEATLNDAGIRMARSVIQQL